MSKECDIVKDLSVNYVDNNLRDNSKMFIEEHLEKCTECRKYVKEMTIDLQKDNSFKEKDEDINILKKINKKIKSKKILIIILSVLLSLVVLYSSLVFVNYYIMSQNPNMEVFLEENISIDDKEKVENKIKNTKDIEYNFVSKEDALNKLKETFGENEGFLNGFNSQNNPLPESYVITGSPESIEELEIAFREMKGIKKVQCNLYQNPYTLFNIKLITNFTKIKNNLF